MIENGPCSASDSVTVVVDVTGTGENASGNSMRVYPNPTSGQVMISGEGIESRSFVVTVYNNLGKKVMTFENTCTPDLSVLSGGIYFLIITNSDGEMAMKKIVLLK